MKHFVDLLERIKRENLSVTIIAQGHTTCTEDGSQTTYRIKWGDPWHHWVIKEVYDDCVILQKVKVKEGVEEGEEVVVSISAIAQILL